MEQDASKKYVRWAAFVALLVFAYAAMVYANSYAKMIQPGSFRTFAVTGEGRATAKNDIAQFTYSVHLEGGKDISKIKQESDQKTKKIQDFLKAQGVDEKDIQTASYNLAPRYQYYSCNPTSGSVPCKPAEIVGYTLDQTDSVKIRSLGSAEKIVSGAVDNGANTVSQLNFTVDDQSELQNQAKAEAIKKAIEQAKSLAQAGGFKVGRIISIEDGGPSPIAYDRAYGMGGAEMAPKALLAPSSQASLAPGSRDYTSSVVVRFEIQ